ncbi:hypothetical protein [Kosakonia sp. R1.Fl]|uniref:hypothetical protein n=1 Tax=Kosakonia sp. R1.Fl TaxID=2928706 RepID=UPI00201E01E4|nr:hypothetical protein [Kosakonia sp. R1.Fl]MCL6742438.1 hypothetical protein [Kosakonia sp. R1.Fl]
MLRPTFTGSLDLYASSSAKGGTTRTQETTRTNETINATPASIVTLSPQAKEYYENLQENLNTLNRFTQENAQNSKANARAKLEALKREIARLKALAMLFGGSGGYIMKQLKQLSSQLGQLASQLGQSDNTGAGTSADANAAGAVQVSSGESDEPAVKAQAASDADVNDEENPTEKEKTEEVAGVQSTIDNVINTLQNASQRQEDARSLKEALRELKSLLSLIKSKMREEGKASDNERNDIASVEQNLNDSGNVISQMELTPGI